ncbi:MAG: efflux RND transporter periplasmic adaptor subunit [Planctomycetes bacterium]|nr:efflux RND transporter periplasmic adaptor subunit [Planctomycetota bacterium]
MKHWIRKMIVALVLLGLMGGAAAWYVQRSGDQDVAFRTAKVVRGDLLVSISATGTLEPEEVIDVGAQVAGQIVSFGKDADGKTVDYGSHVEAGTVLAQIDDSLYKAQAAQATAQVQQANAALQVANANLEQANADLDKAQRDWDRAQKLGPSEALAQSQYDSYKSAYESAQANVAVRKASIAQAQAMVAQTEAAYQQAKRNLDYTTIQSPVKGVIIDRRVNTGQTVVASLNAPSLFLLANDLTRMEVWVAVNEADIGKIYPEQPVTFTVDAFPGETFQGKVGKVRLNASMTQNVVTYTVEIVTSNSSGRLLPYLTANVQFELARRNDALMVPNAVLRWTPTSDQTAPQFRDTTTKQAADSTPSGGTVRAASESGGGPQAAVPGASRGGPAAGNARDMRSRGPQPGSAAEGGMTRGTIWTPEGKYVRPISVQVGQSDGSMTEVQGAGVTDGLEVVMGVQAKATAQADSTNPFAPRFPRRGPTGGGAGGQRGGGAGGARGGMGAPAR